jgi:hypothetical protein
MSVQMNRTAGRIAAQEIRPGLTDSRLFFNNQPARMHSSPTPLILQRNHCSPSPETSAHLGAKSPLIFTEIHSVVVFVGFIVFVFVVVMVLRELVISLQVVSWDG